MSKKLKFSAMLILGALLSINHALADATFTSANEAATSAKNGISLSVTSGSLAKGDYYRIDKGATLTISATSGNITSIVFTCTDASYAKTNSHSPTGTYSESGTTVTWTGSSQSVTFTAKSGSSNKNFRFTKVVITESSSKKTCVLKDGVGGTSTHSGTYTCGTTALPEATAVSGWTFYRWSAVQQTTASYNSSPGTLYAAGATNYTQTTLYALYMNDCDYTYCTAPSAVRHIMETGNPNIPGSTNENYVTITPAGGSENQYCNIPVGTRVNIVATPNSASSFSSWTITKYEDVSTTITPNASTASTYFTMPDYNVSVTANFCSDLGTQTLTVSSPTFTYNTSTEKWDANMTWGAVIGAEYYLVTVLDKETNTKVVNSVNVGNVTKYDVSGLIQDHAHTFAVQARTSCNDTKTTGTKDKTPTCPALAKTTVSYGTKTSTSIVVNWTAVSGADKYKLVVQKRNSADDGWESTPAATFNDLSSATLTKTITGLTPNTKYRANVQALNNCGNAQAVAGEIFTTLAQYTVHFDGNGATGGSAPSDVVKDAGSSYSLPGVGSLTKTGYTFGGWLEGSTSGTLRASGYSHTVNADITFYAKWTIQSYDVTFNMHDHGSAVAKQTIEYNGLVTEPSPAPSDADWKFGGWYKEAGYSNLWNFATDHVTAATTLHAKWTAKTYTNYRTTCCDKIVTAPSVTATDIKTNEITLSWTNVTGATGYTITCAGATVGAVQSSGTTRTCKLTGLTHNVEYTWSVVATYSDPYCDAKTANGTTRTLSWKAYYVDRMHGTNDGHSVDIDGTVYDCYLKEESHTTPAISDDTSGATACHTEHDHLVGWVVKEKVNDDGTLKDGYVLLAPGAANTVPADGTIYYAIWGKLAD